MQSLENKKMTRTSTSRKRKHKRLRLRGETLIIVEIAPETKSLTRREKGYGKVINFI